MLFHEIYGIYFQTVAAVLTEASKEGVTEGRLTELVRKKAFGESILSIPAALKTGDWPLLDDQRRSVLRHPPTMPFTTLQKRWMKALLLDPRIALFAPDTSGLEDVESLYTPDVFVFFDRYTDGDPFEDETYIACFQRILQALQEKRRLRICFHGQTGIPHSLECIPWQLEYSSKDDKFRLLTLGEQQSCTINLGRVRSCELLDSYDPAEIRIPYRNTEELTFLLHDERNALERVLLHFSHLEKETQRLKDGLYQVTLRYDKEDEAELLIRILSFGPVLKVTAPESMIHRVHERIKRQITMTNPTHAEF